MMAGGVLGHGFNHRVDQAFAAEVIERVLDQLAAQTAIAKISGHRKIRNAAFPSLAIDHRGDVADDAAFGFGDEDSRWISCHVFVDVTRFAPAPVAPMKNPKRLL